MIVITGPTGNVGAEVVRLLAERSPALPYRVAAHTPERIKSTHGPQVPAVKFDYDDRSTWGPVLEGVSTLFLLFPLPHPRTVNTRMKPFINAAVEAGCKHFVYISVPGAETYKFVPHYQVERHMEASGVPYTFLRPSYFMQNLCRAISTHGVDIAEHDELFIPGGEGRTTFIDSRDVATLVLDVFQNPDKHRNKAYTLAGPESLDLHQVAAIMSEGLGRPIRYANPSLPAFWWRMWRRGVAPDVIFFMTLVYTLTRRGRNEVRVEQPLTELLGRPATILRQFVAENRWRWEQRKWT
jgi:uncharacterized protein YbjT (DUF2867 family)